MFKGQLTYPNDGNNLKGLYKSRDLEIRSL